MVAREVESLRHAVTPWRRAGQRIALVPTMGALHDGHRALVGHARTLADHVVVSIFVNPTQFAPHEDLDRYPRQEARDLAILTEAGASLVWMPAVGTMYPEGCSTRISPGTAADGLETDHRPHFFGGVASVVAKLLNQVTPDIALFGEKDYQQLCVVRQMVQDLDMNVEILGHPTVREADGLALSSRNAYLREEERQIAPALFEIISQVARQAPTTRDLAGMRTDAASQLLSRGFASVDYIDVRDAATLGPYRPDRTGRVLAAAWLGRTRLIDNVAVGV
ncbi:MAG: pantoate--beta-alanine ligase [Hyphomicrobiaceae bacterium]|nr:pantoate--beta-alanine ligase [Hyphomicrobiaceae bacterium]